MLNRRRFLIGLSGLASTSMLPGCITVPAPAGGFMSKEGDVIHGMTPSLETGGSRAFSGSAVTNASQARAVFEGIRNPWFKTKTAQQWLDEFESLSGSTASRLLTAAEPLKQHSLTRATLDGMAQALQPALQALVGYERRKEADYLQANPATARRLTPRAVVNQDGAIVIPPGTSITFQQKSYCLDRTLPAPNRDEKFRLMPITELYPEAMIPLAKSVVVHAMRKPSDRTSVQQILWAMRAAKDCDADLAKLNPRLMRIMDQAHPNGMAAYQAAYTESCRTGFTETRERLRQRMVGGTSTNPLAPLADTLSELGAAFSSLPAGLQNLSKRIMNPNVTINGRPATAADLFTASQPDADAMVESILDDLIARTPKTAIRENNSDHTLLAPGVAAWIVGTNPLAAQYHIVNASSVPFTFDPAKYAVYSERETQRMPILPVGSRDIRTEHLGSGIVNPVPVSERAKALVDELQHDLKRAAAEMIAYHGMPKWLSQAHTAFRNPLVRGLTQRAIKGVPLVGNVIALYELTTGKDFFKPDDDLNVTERTLAGLSVIPGLNSLTALGRAGLDVAQSSALRRALLGALERGTPAYRSMDDMLTRTLIAREAIDVVAGNDALGAGDAMDDVYQAAFDTSYQLLDAVANNP